jgi:hypothetical protein
VRAQWGDGLGSVLPDTTSALPEGHWQTIAHALGQGDYPQLIRSLAERNAAVMHERGGALAWLEVTDQGQLRVRFRGEDASELPDRDTVRGLWTYPYFIPSLRSVLSTLREGRR